MSIVLLVLALRFVLQLDYRPAWVAPAYCLGAVVLNNLLGAPLLPELLASLVTLGFVFLYLTGLKRLSGWAFWALLVVGVGIPSLSGFLAKQFETLIA